MYYLFLWSISSDLLQLVELKSGLQVPFHLRGIGPIPSSLKLLDSGHIPAHEYNILTCCYNT